MHSLYIDSTGGLVVGLLDSNFTWVEQLNLDEKKPSEIIHFEIFTILKKYNLKLEDIQFFISSGPGSYTGMRLSEGLAQIFELSNIPVYSFYHFEVPLFCNVKKGFWACNAFKGQVFVYSWNGEQAERVLVNKSDFKIESEKLGYTMEKNDSLFLNLKSTRELITENAQEIFSKISSRKLREPPYYFRSLEEEFH